MPKITIKFTIWLSFGKAHIIGKQPIHSYLGVMLNIQPKFGLFSILYKNYKIVHAENAYFWTGKGVESD